MAEYSYPCQNCQDAVTSSRRRSGAVNCAPCARLKDVAVKTKTYAALMSAFESAPAQGLHGEEFRSYAVAAAAGNVAAWREQRRISTETLEAARAARREQNTLLRAHGYRWVKVAIGTEDSWAGAGSVYSGTGEDTGEYWWDLVAPDGTSVETADALAAIASCTLAQEQAEAEIAADVLPPTDETYTPLAELVTAHREYGLVRALHAAHLADNRLYHAGKGAHGMPGTDDPRLVVEAGIFQGIMNRAIDATRMWDSAPVVIALRAVASGQHLVALAAMRELEVSAR